jgi:hypothetical protein
LERGLVLAKQVLSQLSYTPTVGTVTNFKSFAAVRNLGNATGVHLDRASSNENCSAISDQSAIEEDRFVRALQHHVPFQPAVAQFFRGERVASPRFN